MNIFNTKNFSNHIMSIFNKIFRKTLFIAKNNLKSFLKYTTIFTALIIILNYSLNGYFSSQFKKLFIDETQFTTISFIKSNPIDLIFTSFIYMNFTDFIKNDNKISGLCSRTYEIGIGYNNIKSIIEENINSSCIDDIKSLPEPKIISMNILSSEIHGNYNQYECDSWDDTSKSGLRPSLGAVSLKLRREGQWPVIAENSRHILTRYINLYCP